MKKLIIAFFVLCSTQVQAFNFGDFIDNLFFDEKDYIKTTQKIAFDDGRTFKDEVENSLTFLAFMKENLDIIENKNDENLVSQIHKEYYAYYLNWLNLNVTNKNIKQIAKAVVDKFNLVQPSCKYSKWEIDGKTQNGRVIKVTCPISKDIYALVETEDDGDYVSTSVDNVEFKVDNQKYNSFIKKDAWNCDFVKSIYEGLHAEINPYGNFKVKFED